MRSHEVAYTDPYGTYQHDFKVFNKTKSECVASLDLGELAKIFVTSLTFEDSRKYFHKLYTGDEIIFTDIIFAADDIKDFGSLIIGLGVLNIGEEALEAAVKKELKEKATKKISQEATQKAGRETTKEIAESFSKKPIDLVQKKPIIIGENMKRVKEYADKVGGHAYSPWKNSPFDYELGMKRNKQWINQARKENRIILDIGPDFQRRRLGRDPSDFYNMERSQLLEYEHYKKVFERTGKMFGGVSGLDF